MWEDLDTRGRSDECKDESVKLKVLKVFLIGLLCVGALPIAAGKRTEVRTVLSPEREAQFYYDFYAAQKAMNDGHYAQAFCLFRLCASIHPTDAKTQDYLGLIYEALHMTDSARVAYARAYANAPDEIYEHHVTSLMNQGQYKSALKIMKAAVKTNADNADAWNMLLRIAIANADYRTATKAIDEVDKLLGTSPYSALVRYQIEYRRGNIKKAILHMDDYITQVPDNPTLLNDYAYLLATHKGDLNRAEQMSAKAIQLQPNNPSFLDTYGWILHLKKQDSLAQFYLNKALRLATDPNEKIIIEQHLEKVK